ncbi:MAG: hypothetical protein LN411_02125 [Candidatus Thermoplasmatota archaeon]|nr:hypothetical protein [Candidatus Thermoplasmatota archaeon]
MVTLRASFENGPEISIILREDGTSTVEKLLSSVPFRAKVNRWGDEVYFDAPVSAELEEDARAVMEVGEVAFWPDGSAMAIFFGPTPVSTDGQPRAYSPCNMLGRVSGDATLLRSVVSGSSVEVSKEP